jgi:hypothetical protein
MTSEVQRELSRPPADPVLGTLAWPPVVPADAVVLVGGSGGREPDELAGPLAASGVAAPSVAPFARQGLPPALARIELRSVERVGELLLVKLARSDCEPPRSMKGWSMSVAGDRSPLGCTVELEARADPVPWQAGFRLTAATRIARQLRRAVLPGGYGSIAGTSYGIRVSSGVGTLLGTRDPERRGG